MSKPLVIGLLIAAGGAAVCGFSVHLRDARWEEAYWQTRDAWKRAAEYKDRGTLLFEPRYRELKKRLDALGRLPAESASDRRLLNLRLCVNALDNYRVEAETGMDVNAPLPSEMLNCEQYGNTVHVD